MTRSGHIAGESGAVHVPTKPDTPLCILERFLFFSLLIYQTIVTTLMSMRTATPPRIPPIIGPRGTLHLEMFVLTCAVHFTKISVR